MPTIDPSFRYVWLIWAGAFMLPWNPIYPGIAALFVGALATGLCRPDLWRNTLVGGLLFLALYTFFVLGLKWIWPGYIEAVWNLDDLILWRPGGLPLEELFFGFGIGMYWSCIYEHVTWRQRDALRESSPPTGNKNSPLTRNYMKTGIKTQ